MGHLTKIDKSYRISLGKEFTELLGAKPGDHVKIKLKENELVIIKTDVIERILERKKSE